MKRELYTAETIEKLAQEDGQTTLVLGKGDIVTPLARDRARELGLTLIWPEQDDRALPAWSAAAQVSPPRPPATAAPAPAPAGNDLEQRVKQAVANALGKAATETDAADNSGRKPRVLHVDGRGVAMAPFPFNIRRPEMDVRLADVITARDGSPMSAGFMSLHKGQFPWTLNYDEIEFVIEGELHIITNDETIVGLPGDVIFIPKGSRIQFATPGWAKFLYVTYPADWSG
jgi:ethanolamine utilization protein EutQ